ncbi:Ubiquitin-like modifier-activating enzyme ATG7 [Leucoagaricus sp. SymC.cos]|nr:Ubiquitin-like modifier-activating enzyme ATG7 [Leucoagaricus sp. SymC.cos]
MHHFPRVLAHPLPSADQADPGWPLRNLLAYLRALYPQSTSTLHILCWCDIDLPSNDVWKSCFGVLTPTTRPSTVGWEKNPQGKLGPCLADLSPMMDPGSLAYEAVDLSLKFICWRIIPELNLEKILPIRCLLLGAGSSRAWSKTAHTQSVVLNAAIGFDTCVVMRHGSRGASPSTNVETGTPQRHYCSLTDRALDRMCTVTRPRLAPIAAATAVERRFKHQIRGYLAQFRNLNVMGASYDKRSGCSETVVQAYEKEGFTVLLKAFNDQKYFESPTGLDKLLDKGQLEVLESVDWDEDEDDVADGVGDEF